VIGCFSSDVLTELIASSREAFGFLLAEVPKNRFIVEDSRLKVRNKESTACN
jgi:hypothetical protein